MLCNHIPLLTITYHYIPHIYHLVLRGLFKSFLALSGLNYQVQSICVFSLDSTELIDLFIDLNEQYPSPPTYQVTMSE